MTIDLDLPAELTDLGLALGIVATDGGAPYVNDDWFAHPDRYLGGVFSQPAQREALLRLAARTLADPAADLDLPDVPEGQQWVPLATSGAGGLHLVVSGDGDSAVLGLGARVATAGTPALSATVHVPLLRVGGPAAGFVVGTTAGTIAIAVTATLDGAAAGGIALDGAALALTVPTDSTAPVLSVTLTGLRRDGAPPRDIRVGTAEPEAGLLDAALSVLLGLVGDAGGPLADLLALAGLGGIATIPPLPLADVLARGREPAVAWLRKLAADAGALRAWFGRLAGLLGVEPAVAVGGSGATLDPFTVTVPAGSAEVAFTLVTSTAAASGAPVLRPGVRVRFAAPGGVPALAEARADLAEITVGDRLSAQPLPAARLVAHLGPAVPLGGADPLVDTALPTGTPVRVGALEAGLALGPGGGPVLVLAALDVTVGADTHPVVDLTMPDAVRQVAAGGLDAVVDDLLATLGNSVEATALLALLGLRRPGALPVDAPWPHAVALPAFFTDPLGALAAFHTTVLGTADWGVLAAELGTLLGTGTAVVAGAGSADDPWRLPLAVDGPAAVALRAWGAGGARLHVGLAVQPGVAAGSLLRAALDVELIELALTPSGPATVMPGAAAVLTVAGDAPLGIDLGIVDLEIGAVTAGVHWRRGTGTRARVTATDASALVDGTRVPLPVPAWDSGAPAPVLPADFPWPVLTRVFADALLTRGAAWLAGLATLTGWDAGPPTVVTVPPGMPTEMLAGLPVERLPGDPAGVLRDWVARLLADVDGVAAARIAAWLGTVTAGAVPGGGAFGAEVGGAGTAANPYRVGLGTAVDAAEVTAWFEPDGTTLGGVPDLALPDALTRPLDLADGDPPDGATLAGVLRAAAGTLPEIAAVVDGRADLAAGLDALIARLAGSDGLVPLAAQTEDGATVHTAVGLTHLEAPLGFEPAAHLPAGTDPARVLHVAEPLPGLAAWPQQGAAPVVDLSDPGPDLSALAGPGPWFAALAPRAVAGGSDAQADLLGEAVSAAGAGVTVVAHGAAGIVARALAARPGSGIARLVTVAAPLRGATTEFLDEPGTGDAVRALQALAAHLPDAAREDPFAADGIAVLDLLGAVLDAPAGRPFPTADLRLAEPPGPLPAGVELTAVTVGFDAAAVARALASVVRRAISSGLDGSRATRPVDAIGLGVRVRLGTDAASPGRVGVTADLRADLHRFRIRDGADNGGLPRVIGRIAVRRAGGWLAGAPRPDHDPTLPREPRLRWAEITVVRDLGWRVAVTLHEAAALGVVRSAWTIDLDDAGGLAEEDRILLGRLADALTEPDAGPAAVAITGLLRALGVLGPDGLALDAAERLLVHPEATVAARLADAAAAGPLRTALAAVTGGTVTGDGLGLDTGDLRIGIGLGSAPDLILATAPDGMTLGSGLLLAGTVTIPLATDSGRTAATLRVGLSETGPGLAVTVDPTAARTAVLRLDGPDGGAELFPAPDTTELTALLARLVPAELVRLAMELAVDVAPGAVEPLLTAVGLHLPGDPPGAVRHPAALLADPAGRLRAAFTGAAAGLDLAVVQSLVDALRDLTGDAGPPGTLALPGELALRAAPGPGGALLLDLGWPAARAVGPVAVSGGVTLTVPTAGPPSAAVALAVDVTTAPGTGRVELGIGPQPRLTLTVSPDGGNAVVLPIVPPGGPGGLADAAAAGVRALLPDVLDALVDAGTQGPAALAEVGNAVAAVGDALGLRTAAGFDRAALTALAADPTGALLARLRAAAAAALPALGDLVTPALPPGAVTVDTAARALTVAVPGSPLTVTLTVPAVGEPRLCGRLTGFAVADGLAFDAELCVAADGLRLLALGATAATKADGTALLATAGQDFFAFAAVAAGPDAGEERCEIGLWLAPPGRPGAMRSC